MTTPTATAAVPSGTERTPVASAQTPGIDRLCAAIPGLLERCARPGHSADAQLVDVPNAYHAPCHEGPFQMQFYWDTFFVNRVLLALGRIDEARAAVENLVHLLGVYGHVPNCNHTNLLNRSQPPMLALMVDDVCNARPDSDWLARIIPALVDEQEFWRDKRSFEPGLSHYGHTATRDELLGFSREIGGRLGFSYATDDDRVRVAGHYLAEAESGWDFTPRFSGRCLDFAPVDLNCLLYRSESIIARRATQLGQGALASEYRTAAARRRELINAFLWNDSIHAYRDWDTVERRHSAVASLASFYPLWCGVASKEQARDTVASLAQFERPHGLAACAPGKRDRVYQWDYPNGWAPLHLIALEGLCAYDFVADASRVARSFLGTVERCHAKTGELWEKYNVVRGTLDVQDEYPMPPLVGWTAASVLWLKSLL